MTKGWIRKYRGFSASLAIALLFWWGSAPGVALASPPNILVAIADDQSFPHASAYGFKGVQTPAFDRVARAGVLFGNAFTPAPGCSPMRAAFLTGRHIWQIEQAGTHASSFPTKYEVFPDRLERSGYVVGYTGKGWGPGNWEASGRTRNPAGPKFSSKTCEPPATGMATFDYAANFDEFLNTRSANEPFCFWFGSKEPHRKFEKGSGLKSGKSLRDVAVPPFLPDRPEIRSDILDYLLEIEWFDEHLGRMLDNLEERGELENTLVIVTSDNGMAFPRAKANVYEYGIHMPLAVAWPKGFSGGRHVDDLVNLIDVTATLYEATRVEPPFDYPLSGRSLMNVLLGQGSGVLDPTRDAVFSARERHSSSRFNSLSYPQRSIRTHDYLYIWNLRPERWPAGTPQKFETVNYDSTGEVIQGALGPVNGAYHDIDACPSLSFMIEHREDDSIRPFLELAVARRPEFELYDIRVDPGCLKNLAGKVSHRALEARLANRLQAHLRATGDARIVGPNGGEIWETYPRYSSLRWFPTPDWVSRASLIQQDWLESRRPRQ